MSRPLHEMQAGFRGTSIRHRGKQLLMDRRLAQMQKMVVQGPVAPPWSTLRGTGVPPPPAVAALLCCCSRWTMTECRLPATTASTVRQGALLRWSFCRSLLSGGPSLAFGGPEGNDI